MGRAMMQRLKTRAQFQAAMAAGFVARTPHFALHRLVLDNRQLRQSLPPHHLSGPDVALTQPAHRRPCLPLWVRRPGTPAQPWLGPLVPKRWAKRSVTRHLLRRQIYAVALDFAAQLPPGGAMWCGCVPRLTPSALSAPARSLASQAVRSELQQLFGYAVRKLGGAGPAAAANLAAPGVLRMMQKLLMALVKGYRLLLSPWLGSCLPV